jgi:uracil-DNA glycosylase
MLERLPKSWGRVLGDEFGKDYFLELRRFLENEYGQKKIFPVKENIFKAFEVTPFEEVKVVILGQDPYHGEGQAEGLSFSVPAGVKLPPSLKNIYKEIISEFGGEMPESGNLEKWAEQGVFLLNATLTVEEGRPASHNGRGWEEFTDRVIGALAREREVLVFMLWGKFAQSKASLIDGRKHLILQAAHPSPFSAYRGFFACDHFKKANEYLCQRGKSPINWI